MRSEVVRLRAAGLSYDEIAARLGTTRGAVAGHLSRHRRGVGVARDLGITREMVEAELAANGNNRSAAARKFGVCRPSIDSRTARPPTRGMRGQIHATDPETRAVLEAQRRAGLNDYELSDLSGVGVRTIQHWRAGRKPSKQHLEWVREAIARTER